MRNKVLVPIGQGCKPRPVYMEDGTKTDVCRCKEHFWMYLNVCVQCGEKYHSVSPHKRTCSDACRKAKSRSKHDKFFQSVLQFAQGERAQ